MRPRGLFVSMLVIGRSRSFDSRVRGGSAMRLQFDP